MERMDMLLDPVKAALIQVAHFSPNSRSRSSCLIGWLLARRALCRGQGLACGQLPVLTERGPDGFYGGRYPDRHDCDPRSTCPDCAGSGIADRLNGMDSVM
jgi:hypothetical protein